MKYRVRGRRASPERERAALSRGDEKHSQYDCLFCGNHTMARIQAPPPHEQPTSAIHAVTLADEKALLLRQLRQDASDFLGRTSSSSAVIRARIRQMGKQGPPAADALCCEIERELKGGMQWGRKLRRVNNS